MVNGPKQVFGASAGITRFEYGGSLGDLVSSDPRRRPNPPRYQDLIDTPGLVAPADDPDRFFDADESSTAAWLRTHEGIRIRSVHRRPGLRNKTPDAVGDQFRITLDMKHRTTRNGAVTGVRQGRAQSDRIVFDLRDADVDWHEFSAGLDEGLRKFGLRLNEILIIRGDDGAALHWVRG